MFRIQLLDGLQYRAQAFSGAAVSILYGLIEAAIMIAFFTFSDGAGSLDASAGMTVRQAVSYIWIAQWFVVMSPSSAVDSDTLKKINNGDIGIELCRPFHLYHQLFARQMALRFAPLVWRGSLVLLVALLLPEPYRLAPPASALHFLAFLVSAMNAALFGSALTVLTTAIRMNIAWGDGPMHIMMLLSSVLTGAYLPLALWPEGMQTFLRWQPFAAMVDTPTRLYIGTMTLAEAPMAWLVQWAWTAALLFIGWIVMEKRLKNAVVQGG